MLQSQNGKLETLTFKIYFKNDPKRKSRPFNFVAKLKNSKVDRMTHVTALAQSNCDEGFSRLWSRLWLKCGNDVLHKNELNRFVFADALRTLMKKCRGKYHNIILVGQSGCAKTFNLEPQKLSVTMHPQPPGGLVLTLHRSVF